MESFLLFFEKCRLCLNQSGVYNMFECKTFPEDIYLCTGIKVHSSDNLPKNLCKRCFKVIQNATALRILASKTNTHIKALLHSGNVEATNKTPENMTSSDIAETQEIIKQTNENQTVSTTSTKTISVRKDLFESSSTVSSTEKETSTPSREEPHVTEKRQSSQHEEQVQCSSCKKTKVNKNAITLECSICSKKFETWKKLYLHKRLHNKTIKCPLNTCGKKFSTNADLEKHYRTHTGERPFECDLCDRSFSQKCTLKVHKEKLHNATFSDKDAND